MHIEARELWIRKIQRQAELFFARPETGKISRSVPRDRHYGFPTMPAKKKTTSPAPATPAARTPRKKSTTAPTAPTAFEGELVARAAALFADDKKAENIAILDVRGISMVTDFLVICDGSSLPHLRAIQNEIAGRMRQEHSVKPFSSHGVPESGWMLLDFGDVVVHIFHAEKRAYYALEELWNDAPRLS
jgi:ribosome-associated protein